MDETARKIIAYVFKKTGKKKLSESEFYLTISMDLKWCPPDASKEFLKNLISNGLLNKDDKHVFPNFDVDTVVIPIQFQPDKSYFFTKNSKENEENP